VSVPRIDLALVLHNHQPVGNFGFVLEENHRLAYRPMLDALDRHPGVRVGLHYTGPLLEWLAAEKPDSLDLVRRLIDRGQVEVLGGGLYEPVLAALPDADRHAQLTRMAAEVARVFGTRPTGAWLAERVWEPDLPSAIADAGYAWTVLDDAHLRAAAVPDERHWEPYSTDDRGRRIAVFGTEKRLRYLIPFHPISDVIEHLRAHATPGGERVGMMGDDGEKFGAWPRTWELCWGRETWVDRFFDALERESGWLRTLRPSDALREHPPTGRILIPTASYAEMEEWSLPVEARLEFTALRHADLASGRPEARWMRGGFWRAFQANYREINDLHKQMLRASARVATLVEEAGPDGIDPRLERVVDHLHRGQSNDCYWHGLFGGIYLPDLRLASLRHLIAADDGAERLVGTDGDDEPTIGVEWTDTDLDGADEAVISGPGQVVRVRPRDGGGIDAWDIRPARHALLSVMRRRPEAYHDTLRAMETGTTDAASSGAVSIHDLVVATESGLEERLWYDAYERRSGLVHLLPLPTAPDVFERAAQDELADLISGGWDAAVTDDGVILERAGNVRVGATQAAIHARKTIVASGGRLDPTLALEVAVTNRSTDPIEALLGVEWSLNLLGGGGNPAAWIELDGSRERFDARQASARSEVVAMGNDDLEVRVEASATPAAAAWWSSIDTISVSEQGFEANHQGGCLLWAWPLRLAPGATMTVAMGMRVTARVDRAEREGL
jgi:alpha-amylase